MDTQDNHSPYMDSSLSSRNRCRGNESIIKGLHTLGLEAVVITVAAVIGSTLCAWGLWYLLYSKGKETKA